MKFFKYQDFLSGRRDGFIGHPEVQISVGDAAAIANEFLEKHGQVVESYGRLNQWFANGSHGADKHTHKGLLINVEPIEQDTAEDIVADLAKWEQWDGTTNAQPFARHKLPDLISIISRARKLQENK